ncbi:MAG TPA: hypothetical protein VIJ38_17195 [Acidobacteriaceae bacterium]
MPKPKRVRYKRSLICHLDLLGFRELIRTKKPGEISKMLRLFSTAVKPSTRGKEVKALGAKQFVAFSDLHITVIPTEPEDDSARGLIFLQIIRLVHAQWKLFFDHGILVRGGIVVGDAIRSYDRFFGQGIIDAYDVESKQALYPRIVVHASVFEELKVNPQVWTHDGGRKGEIKAVKNLLHHDVENGLYYIDYLRVMESELDNPDYYSDCLEMFRTKVGEMISETSHAGAISKLEWMQRYHRRIVQTAQRH